MSCDDDGRLSADERRVAPARLSWRRSQPTAANLCGATPGGFGSGWLGGEIRVDFNILTQEASGTETLDALQEMGGKTFPAMEEGNEAFASVLRLNAKESHFDLKVSIKAFLFLLDCCYMLVQA